MRVASQLTFCSPKQILRQAIVEQDDNKVIKSILSLENQQVETANTLFFDGIISKNLVSIQQQLHTSELPHYISEYQYLDLRAMQLSASFFPSNKPLVLDFGTSDPAAINRLLQLNYPFLNAFSIFEIIAAAVYYPALILSHPPLLEVGLSTDLLLWKSIDLVNKKQTMHTSIFMLNT